MPELRRMDADLVLAAGLQLKFHLGVIFCALEHFVVRNGQLSFFHFGVEGLHFQGFGTLYQPALDGTGVFFHLAFQPGHITALGHQLFPFALQKVLGALVLGKNHGAGSAFVQAVHNPHLGGAAVWRHSRDEVLLPLHALVHLHVGVQQGVQRLFAVSALGLASPCR